MEEGDDEPIETSLSFSQNEPEAPAVSDSFFFFRDSERTVCYAGYHVG